MSIDRVNVGLYHMVHANTTDRFMTGRNTLIVIVGHIMYA